MKLNTPASTPLGCDGGSRPESPLPGERSNVQGVLRWRVRNSPEREGKGELDPAMAGHKAAWTPRDSAVIMAALIENS